MKKTILLLIIIGFIKPIYSQNSLTILEEAYFYFNAGNHKDAVDSFEKYFAVTKGSKDDFYFMAASLASIGKTKESLKYSEKACNGIETLEMMLADTLFRTTQKQLLIKYNQLKLFYTVYNKAGFNDRIALRKIDSLYTKLEIKKIVESDLIDISKRHGYFKDTLKAMYYLREAILTGNENSEKHGLILETIDAYEIKYSLYFNNYFPFIKSLKKWTTAYKRHLNNNKNDSAAFALENLFIETPNIFATPELLYKAACFFSLSKNYEKAGKYLVRSIDGRFKNINTEFLFTNKDLITFFESQPGQNTLKYIISKYHKTTFINADYIFETNLNENSKSKSLIYDYLKAKDFNAQIPKSFEVFKKDEQTLYMPLFWEDKNLQKTDFKYVFSINENGLIKISAPKNELDKIVLCKKTANSLFADNPGSCYTFPLENREFIKKTALGEIPLSNIHQIILKHLAPLKKYAFSGKMLTGIYSNNERFFFSMGMGMEYIAPSMIAIIKEKSLLELDETIEYTKYSLIHSAFFDIVIKIIQDSVYYNSLSIDDKSKYKHKVSSLYTILPFKALVGDVDSLLPKYDSMLKFNKTISQWWENYKYENQFKLPQLLYNKSPVSIETKNINDFIYFEDKEQEIIFYDPIQKTVQNSGSTYNFDSKNFIKVGTIGNKSFIFTPSHHNNPHEFFVYTDLNKNKLKKLQLIAESLNLKPLERITTQDGGFKLSFDRFYVAKAFNDFIYIWHDNDRIFINSLSKTKDLNIEKNVLIDNKKKVCNNNTNYIESLYCLNSLKSKEINNKLYVLLNSNIITEPYCKNQYMQKTYLLKLNKNLQIEKEFIIPKEFTSNPNVELITTNDKIFAIIWPECCGPVKGYYQIFDYDLNPISEVIEISMNIGQQSMRIPNLAATVLQDKVYVVYPTVENEDQFIKIQNLTNKKENNKSFYLFTNRSEILNNGLINDGDKTLKYNYTEKYNQKYFTKKIEISTEIFVQ